jgi:hypothetical protein
LTIFAKNYCITQIATRWSSRYAFGFAQATSERGTSEESSRTWPVLAAILQILRRYAPHAKRDISGAGGSLSYIIILIGLYVVLVTGCGRIQADPSPESADISVEFSTEPTNPAVGPAQLLIIVTDGDGRPIDNATLDIEGNMTHAGMTPVFTQATGGENGQYVVPFEWTMGGDWIMTVEVALEDGRTASRQFPVVVE